VLLSLCYLVLRRVLQLVALRCRSNDYKELEIVVLRHELAILRRQTRRPALTTVDRLFFTAVSRVLPRAQWRAFFISPATLLRWHRRVVRGGGHTRVLPVVRRCDVRFENWCFGLRERTRGGAINAWSAS
jgi:hypothetical protein